jgi:hypothetical protein
MISRIDTVDLQVRVLKMCKAYNRYLDSAVLKLGGEFANQHEELLAVDFYEAIQAVYSVLDQMTIYDREEHHS